MRQAADLPGSPDRLWKLVRHPLIRMMIVYAAITLIAFPILLAAHHIGLKRFAFVGAHLLSALVAMGIYLASVKWIERRRPSELALRTMLPQFWKGFAIGFALQSCIFIALALCGSYVVTGVNFGLDTASLLVLMFFNALGAGLLEEVWVRGTVFRNLDECFGTWIALALSTILFGVWHDFNPGESWGDIVGIILGPGVLLASAFAYARQLWICIGIHCAWNFTDGAIFGLERPASLLSAKVHGPEWLTGGDTVGNGSVVVVSVCLIASAIFVILAWRRGRIVSWSWKRDSMHASRGSVSRMHDDP